MDQDRRHTFRRLGWLILVAAVLYLAWWGVLRGAVASGDLAVGYGAGAAWLGGANPYDVAQLEEHALAGGADRAIIGQLETLRNVYFPTTLPSFLPLAPLSWPAAKILVLALNLAATGFIAWGLVRLLGWGRTEPRTFGLVAFVVALAPLHTAMAIGQVAILTTAAIVAALLLERSGRPSLGWHLLWPGDRPEGPDRPPIPGLPGVAPALGHRGGRGARRAHGDARVRDPDGDVRRRLASCLDGQPRALVGAGWTERCRAR